MCPPERLVIISNTTGLSFAVERIGPLAATLFTVFYLLALYFPVILKTPENLFASVYSKSLVKTAHHYLLLLVGFDTLIYQKYYDTPPILVGHQGTGSQNSLQPEEEGSSTDKGSSNRFPHPQCPDELCRYYL